MTVPTIHLNGTSGQALLDQLCDAKSALYDALEKMAQAAPHGRDYYPQGPDAYRAAADEHQDRMQRVNAVMAEIEALATAVYQAMHSRR